MRLCGISAVLILLCVAASRASDDGVEFFESRIRPILIQHCYECHSSQSGELKGRLSVENAASINKGGDSGPVLVAGQPEQSLLLHALKYDGIEMPPTGKLPGEVIRDFETWIAMGAPDPRTGEVAQVTAAAPVDIAAGRQFWAFQPPVRSTLPEVNDASWTASEIDQFILVELERHGLSPSPEIDKARLLRRVTYDLTGLPPTESEVLAFLSDNDPLILSRVVDRLLASREYAEQWARHWLDVARYADSNGGDFNATFHEGWRYRNYVIDAYEQDLPYDQFVREQLAGDLLPGETEEESARRLIATGFLVIGPKMLSERDKLKLKMDVIDEQIDTVGKALLGMTLGCARCHDHKFDPIPTTDYYAMAGIFRSTECLDGEIQQYVSNYVRRPLPITPDHAAALAKYDSEKKTLAELLNASKMGAKKANADLQTAKSSGMQTVVDDAQADKTGDWKPSTHVKPFVGDGYLHDDQKDKGQKSARFKATLTRPGMYEVRMSYTTGDSRATNTPVSIQHADGKVEFKVNQRQAPEIEGLYHTLGTYRFDPAPPAFVEITTTDTDGHVIADAVAFVAIDPSAEWVPQVDLVAFEQAVQAANEQVKAHEQAIKELDAHAPPPAPAAISLREADLMIDCRVHVRGEPRQLGAEVPRGFLQVASMGDPPTIPKTSSGRRELAEWISDPRHPLTARVYVNRVWQKLLGEGLVRSVDNFGELGDRPTHLQLLDNLTLDFIAHGWSTKWLIREIVLSRVYRQDSRDRPECFAIDPENRKLWRAPRKRLTAEQLRDSLLLISGQLQPSDAGSPVQGLGTLVDNNQANSQGYQGSDSPVRSIYLPVIRNEVSTLLTVFDFADPDFVVGRREVTTVPAQALTMLNHPFVANASARTAELMWQSASPSDDQRFDWVAARLWGRLADATERQRVQQFREQEPSVSADDIAKQKQVWARTIHAMFASTEFQFVD